MRQFTLSLPLLDRIARSLRFWSNLLAIAFLSSSVSPAAGPFYASPTGTGTSACTNSAGPYCSLEGAKALARANAPTVVYLKGGTYYLPKLLPATGGTLMFTSADSGTSPLNTISWRNVAGETPILNGGMPVTGASGFNQTWTHQSGNLWTVPIPTSGMAWTVQNFENLFYYPVGGTFGERRMRARAQSSAAPAVGYFHERRRLLFHSVTGEKPVDISLCNLGTYLRVGSPILVGRTSAHLDRNGAAVCPQATGGNIHRCQDRFKYNASDDGVMAALAANLTFNSSAPAAASKVLCRSDYPGGDIQLNLLGTWTVDTMRINCVDTANRVVYLTDATRFPPPSVFNTGGTVTGHRYVIENSKSAFLAAQAAGQTGIWFLDRSGKDPLCPSTGWCLHYLANRGENPNADTVIVPQSTPKPIADYSGGTLISANGLQYVTISGIGFEVDNYVIPPEGYNKDAEEAYVLPAAIDCESCQHVTFGAPDGIFVRHTSASGITIASISNTEGAPAKDSTIQNSAFYDIGANGVNLGHLYSPRDVPGSVTRGITVHNSIIQGYGRVFPSGYGIGQTSGTDSTYTHNDITDGYHAAIAFCNFGCPSVDHSANGFNITSSYNHVWNIIQGVMNDIGTLYYNLAGPKQPGSGNGTISNNLIHDVTDSSIIDGRMHYQNYGFGGSAIYIDNNTGNTTVRNNVVFRISEAPLRTNKGPRGYDKETHHDGLANTFSNNILAFGNTSMFMEVSPWNPAGCTTPTLRNRLVHNIFYFNRDDTTSPAFTVQGNGCTYTCNTAGSFADFQDWQGNLYWRTSGGFDTYAKAFHVQKKSAEGNEARCGGSRNPDAEWAWLTFGQWQSNAKPTAWGPAGGMLEDVNGTASINPMFGVAGDKNDFLLSSNPNQGFDYLQTNDTIRNAGRNGITPPTPDVVAATFPTYSYTPADVTVNANVAGLNVMVNGRPYTTTVKARLAQGLHTISVDSPQTVGSAQYVFKQWSDGNTSASRVITAGSTALNYTAEFAVATTSSR